LAREGFEEFSKWSKREIFDNIFLMFNLSFTLRSANEVFQGKIECHAMVSFCFYFNNPIWHWAPTNIPNLLYATFACLSFVFSRVVEIFCQSVFILVYWDYNL